MRTTSSVESLNNIIGKTIPNHPHLFKFIDHLKLHEYSKFMDLNALLNGSASKHQLERKHLRDRERDEKINFFSSELVKKTIRTQTFLEAMANETILPKSGEIFCNPIIPNEIDKTIKNGVKT